MQFSINRITVFVTIFENQFVIHPIAAQAFHAVAFVLVHQFFREKAGEMTDAAHDIAAKEVVLIAHAQYPIKLIFIFIVFYGIHMHGEAFHADFDFPFVAHIGIEVI